MADAIPQGAPSPQADHHHEVKDAQLRSVLLPGIALVVLAVLLFFALWKMMNAFAASPAKPDVALSPFAALPQVPPPPRLQESPADDLARVNAACDNALNSYGWADKSAGRIHIPIEEAETLTLKELRNRPNPAGRTP